VTACTKQTITEKIAKKNNQTPSQAKDTLESLLEIMKSTMASGEDILNQIFLFIWPDIIQIYKIF
jgi:nucleoid DNA-binding protein